MAEQHGKTTSHRDAPPPDLAAQVAELETRIAVLEKATLGRDLEGEGGKKNG